MQFEFVLAMSMRAYLTHNTAQQNLKARLKNIQKVMDVILTFNEHKEKRLFYLKSYLASMLFVFTELLLLE